MLTRRDVSAISSVLFLVKKGGLMASGKETYDRLGGKYDKKIQWLDRWFLNRMRRELLVRSQGRVLEVAVGSGKNLEYYPTGTNVIGLDFSPKMLEAAKRRARHLENVVFETRMGDATRIPFDARSFDALVCTLGGCTFDEPLKVYKEMRRVCKPDGQVLFLEHVKPKPWYLRASCNVIAPLSKRLVHCDPLRETEKFI